MKGDLQSHKCLVKFTFTNLKGPLSKTFKIRAVLGVLVEGMTN